VYKRSQLITLFDIAHIGIVSPFELPIPLNWDFANDNLALAAAVLTGITL